jgi:hypothetical protein
LLDPSNLVILYTLNIFLHLKKNWYWPATKRKPINLSKLSSVCQIPRELSNTKRTLSTKFDISYRVSLCFTLRFSINDFFLFINFDKMIIKSRMENYNWKKKYWEQKYKTIQYYGLKHDLPNLFLSTPEWSFYVFPSLICYGD